MSLGMEPAEARDYLDQAKSEWDLLQLLDGKDIQAALETIAELETEYGVQHFGIGYRTPEIWWYKSLEEAQKDCDYLNTGVTNSNGLPAAIVIERLASPASHYGDSNGEAAVRVHARIEHDYRLVDPDTNGGKYEVETFTRETTEWKKNK